MTISTTCRKVIISKGVLTAECHKADKKTYVSSSISLDAYVGNVDGKFIWGGKGFSHSAQDIGVIDGVLYAKLKGPGGKYVDAKLDLNPHIINNDGVLTAGTTGVTKPKAPTLEKSFSTTSAASAESAATTASATSMFSQATSSTTSSSATSVSSSSNYKSSNHFHSSSFRSQSQHHLIEDTCSNFQLRDDCCFHLDFNHPEGRVSHSHIELDKYIGNVNGELQWGGSGFSKTCRSIVLDGFFLIAECLVHARDGHKEHYVTCRLDLRRCLRILDGILIFIEIERKLSVLLSEVPWMKFKVIAEPDLSVFGSHPVIKQTLIKVSESCVEHVTIEMHRKLTIAMEEAIIAITASAMKHVTVLMETICTDVVGHATACPSVTEAECLHIDRGHYGWGGRHGGHGYGGGGHEGGHGGGYGGGGYGGGGRGGGYGGGGEGGGYGGGGEGGGYGGGGEGGGYGGGGYEGGTYGGGENGGTIHYGGGQGGVVYNGNRESYSIAEAVNA